MSEQQVELRNLRRKAKKLGASDIGMSDRKEKRFYVIYQNNIIHFGAKYGLTYYDHGDPIKRKAWIARHSKIKDKDGNLVMFDKTSPSFWAKSLLW